jgi:peptidoglycan hydrolase-like protein with peptidoglycan-binding domain
MEITNDVAMAIFHHDLGPVIATVNRVVKVPCSQEEFDAMVSIAFNIGNNGFAGSTIVHRLNAGDVDGAADAFLMWDEPPELMGRRQSERLQFLSGGMVPRKPAPGVYSVTLYSTRWLQASLNMLGVTPALDVDGVYGDGTKATVRAFQTSAGIDVDGLAGPQTNDAIVAALAAKASS